MVIIQQTEENSDKVERVVFPGIPHNGWLDTRLNLPHNAMLSKVKKVKIDFFFKKRIIKSYSLCGNQGFLNFPYNAGLHKFSSWVLSKRD